MWTSFRTRLRRPEVAWQAGCALPPPLPLVARYYDHVQHEPAYHRLPDQTWADLNGDVLFGLLDATVSRVGQQCLYHSPLADEATLHAFDAAATLLAQQPEARRHALLALDQLTAREAYYLADLLPGQPLPTLPGALRATARAGTGGHVARGRLATRTLAGYEGVGPHQCRVSLLAAPADSALCTPAAATGPLAPGGAGVATGGPAPTAAAAAAGRAPGPVGGPRVASGFLSGRG